MSEPLFNILHHLVQALKEEVDEVQFGLECLVGENALMGKGFEVLVVLVFLFMVILELGVHDLVQLAEFVEEQPVVFLDVEVLNEIEEISHVLVELVDFPQVLNHEDLDSLEQLLLGHFPQVFRRTNFGVFEGLHVFLNLHQGRMDRLDFVVIREGELFVGDFRVDVFCVLEVLLQDAIQNRIHWIFPGVQFVLELHSRTQPVQQLILQGLDSVLVISDFIHLLRVLVVLLLHLIHVILEVLQFLLLILTQFDHLFPLLLFFCQLLLFVQQFLDFLFDFFLVLFVFGLLHSVLKDLNLFEVFLPLSTEAFDFFQIQLFLQKGLHQQLVEFQQLSPLIDNQVVVVILHHLGYFIVQLLQKGLHPCDLLVKHVEQ